MICDNKYNILAISDCIDGNHHDSFEIIDHIKKMIVSFDQQGIDYPKSHLNADAGFDVAKFIEFIESKQLIANIKENKRNNKKKENNSRYMSDQIYAFRFKIEVVFAWLDSYKRVLIRFEALAQNFKSWLFLAAALINFRHIFN
jgi:transposase